MLSLHTSRKPAPMLARGALWLGRRGGPDAFGNAIGESIKDGMSQPKVPDVASPQEKADIIRMFGGQEGLDSVMRERLAAGRGWDASVRAGRNRRDDLFGEMSYSNSVSDYGLTGSRAADRAILGGLADQRASLDFGVVAGEVFARDSQGGTARYLGYVDDATQGVQVSASRNAWLPEDYRMAFGGIELGQGPVGRDVQNFFLAIQGTSELLYTGTRNGFVKIGSGLVSVPAALRNGADDAVGYQQFLQQKYNYQAQSRGAAMLGQAFAPVASKIQTGLQWTRNTSERYLGDGWTTALGVGIEVGAEAAATFFGLRGLKGGYQAGMNSLYRSGLRDVRWAPGDIGSMPMQSQRGATSLFNFELVTPEGRFAVGNHGSMPAPRPGEHSHHVMSRWMESRYQSYDPDLAPAVLMPDVNHRATFGVYNRWRAEARAQSGGVFDWSNVSEPQMRTLGNQMFDAAKVPPDVQLEYWLRFDKMKAKLGG